MPPEIFAGFRMDKDEVSWFWIGGHADYDRILKNL